VDDSILQIVPANQGNYSISVLFVKELIISRLFAMNCAVHKNEDGLQESGARVVFWSPRGRLGLEAPLKEIAGVEGYAEDVGGDETELGSSEPDYADDGAVNGGDDPALPELFANEDGARDGQETGEIVQSDGVKEI
jgi:hypothetical protein